MENVPARIDALPLGALDQLPLGHGADVGEVVGAGARDDGVPDDGLVGRVGGAAGRVVGPLGRHVDEDLLRVPGEERAEVGVEAELDDGVFLLLGRVVVWAAADSVGEVGVLLVFERRVIRTWLAYTWTLVVLRVPLGALGERKSEAAMRAATANATVVKNPKVFCARTSVVYMVGDVSAGLNETQLRGGRTDAQRGENWIFFKRESGWAR